VNRLLSIGRIGASKLWSKRMYPPPQVRPLIRHLFFTQFEVNDIGEALVKYEDESSAEAQPDGSRIQFYTWVDSTGIDNVPNADAHGPQHWRGQVSCNQYCVLVSRTFRAACGASCRR
jgi:hypothetical protein